MIEPISGRMKEFVDIQVQCLGRMQALPACGGICPNNHYCTSHGCVEGDCSKCLTHIHWDPSPSFHYNCERITYQYFLRFAARYASEIAYCVNQIPFENHQDINIVSLGCGPGTEIFGFLKAFQLHGANTTLNYEGYDLEGCWKPVQNLVKNNLLPTSHIINFNNADIFQTFNGFPNGQSTMLVLNYVLSDVSKYGNELNSWIFIDKIASFILSHSICSVLFNDINYYGTPGAWDSGTQLMFRLIDQLKAYGKQIDQTCYIFPGDPKHGNEGWLQYQNNGLVLPLHNANSYANNVKYCHSKQIIIAIR